MLSCEAIRPWLQAHLDGERTPLGREVIDLHLEECAKCRGEAEALVHMRNAGLAFDSITGAGGYPLVIPYYVYPQSFAEFSAQLLQQELKKIGLRIEIRIVNYPAFLAITHRR